MLLSCQRQEKKDPHIKQNITMPVPVSSTELGGSEWLLAEDTSGTTGGRAVYSSRKRVPALHSEQSCVDTHKWLSMCLFTRVVAALCCLAQVAKPFLNCRVCRVLQTVCPELSAAHPLLL